MNDALAGLRHSCGMPTSPKRWRGLLRVVSYALLSVSRRGAKALGFQEYRFVINLLWSVFVSRYELTINDFLPLFDWSAFRRNDEDPKGIHS